MHLDLLGTYSPGTNMYRYMTVDGLYELMRLRGTTNCIAEYDLSHKIYAADPSTLCICFRLGPYSKLEAALVNGTWTLITNRFFAQNRLENTLQFTLYSWRYGN